MGYFIHHHNRGKISTPLSVFLQFYKRITVTPSFTVLLLSLVCPQEVSESRRGNVLKNSFMAVLKGVPLNCFTDPYSSSSVFFAFKKKNSYYFTTRLRRSISWFKISKLSIFIRNRIPTCLSNYLILDFSLSVYTLNLCSISSKMFRYFFFLQINQLQRLQ